MTNYTKSTESAIKFMELFGLKFGDNVQSISVNFDVHHNYPYVEIVRIIDDNIVEKTYDLVKECKILERVEEQDIPDEECLSI